MSDGQDDVPRGTIPTYGDRLTPQAKALMKSLGGDPRFLALSPKQVERWALDRPESPLNLLGDQELAQAAVKLSEEFWLLTEQELRERVGARPPRVDLRVKLAFWDEYERAAGAQKPMELVNLTQGSGAISWDSFRKDLLANNNLLAWFMIPPPGYRMQLREAQSRWLERLMDILELPLVDPKTQKIRADIGALILQAGKLIDLRLMGAVTQKVVNLSASAGSMPDGAPSSMDMQKVEEELARMRAIVEGRGPQPRTEPPADRVEPTDVVSEVTSVKRT